MEFLIAIIIGARETVIGILVLLGIASFIAVICPLPFSAQTRRFAQRNKILFCLLALLAIGSISLIAWRLATAEIHALKRYTRRQVNFITQEISYYHMEHGRFPGKENGEVMSKLMESGEWMNSLPNRLQPNFDDRGRVIDPWGRPYSFEMRRDSVVIVTSAGPDGISDTSDDIFSLAYP